MNVCTCSGSYSCVLARHPKWASVGACARSGSGWWLGQAPLWRQGSKNKLLTGLQGTSENRDRDARLVFVSCCTSSCTTGWRKATLNGRDRPRATHARASNEAWMETCSVLCVLVPPWLHAMSRLSLENVHCTPTRAPPSTDQSGSAPPGDLCAHGNLLTCPKEWATSRL